MEGRSVYTDSVVARIYANTIVGRCPGDRQVGAVIDDTGDLPIELRTLYDTDVFAIEDRAGGGAEPDQFRRSPDESG